MRTIESAGMSPRIGRRQPLLAVLSIALLLTGLIVRPRGQITCPAHGV